MQNGIGIYISSGSTNIGYRFTSRCKSIWGASLVGLYLPDDAVESAGAVVSIPGRVGATLTASGTITKGIIGSRVALANTRTVGAAGSCFIGTVTIKSAIVVARPAKVIADDYQSLLRGTTPAEFLVDRTQSSADLRSTGGVIYRINGTETRTVSSASPQVFEISSASAITAWSWLSTSSGALQSAYNWGSTSGPLILLSAEQTSDQRTVSMSMFRDFGYGTP